MAGRSRDSVPETALIIRTVLVPTGTSLRVPRIFWVELLPILPLEMCSTLENLRLQRHP
jgi:hypothetical protein